MADDIIQIGNDGAGKMVDNSSLTVGSNLVYRQRFNLADPTDPYGIAKVMSTRPVGTENGLVVRTAGNTYIQGAPQPNVTGTIAALNATVGGGTDFSTAGNVSVLLTGTFTGTLIFEVSWDNVTYIPVQGQRTDTGIAESTTISSSVTPRAWNFSMQGFNYFRVRCTAYSTGSASIVVDGGTGWFSPSVAATVQGNTPQNTVFASTVNPIIAGGTDGTSSRANYVTAKAIQGPYALNVQDLKDSGRSSRNIILNATAVTATAETLYSTQYSIEGGTITSAAVNYIVTNGKRLRIQQITATLHTVSGNTTAAAVIVRIRLLTSATTITASTGSVQTVFALQGTAAASAATSPVSITFPDGWEVAGGSTNVQLGVTLECPLYVATTAAPRIDLTITGYEY